MKTMRGEAEDLGGEMASLSEAGKERESGEAGKGRRGLRLQRRERVLFVAFCFFKNVRDLREIQGTEHGRGDKGPWR